MTDETINEHIVKSTNYQDTSPVEEDIFDTDVHMLFKATEDLPLLAQIEMAQTLIFDKYDNFAEDMDMRLTWLLLRRCRGILEQNPKAALLRFAWD